MIQQVMDRTSDSKPILKVTSSICDIGAVCCAVPCICCGPCFYACGGPYSFTDYTPPPKKSKKMFDEWYRASIFSLHGGSLLQLVATQSLFWSFPLQQHKEDYSIHNVVVYPANKFGECCFAPLVTSSTPQFRIKKIKNIYSVRLNTNICGCCGMRECTPLELNDVWSISANGKVITSIKTRGHLPFLNDYCTCISGTGPAMFVALDFETPTISDVDIALKSEH